MFLCHRNTQTTVCSLIFVVMFFLCLDLQAQVPSKTQTPTKSPAFNGTQQPTAEEIQKKIEQLKETKGLSEEDQKKAANFYNQAIEDLKKTVELQEKEKIDEVDSKNAVQRLNDIKAKIESENKKSSPSYTHILNLPKLEQDLVQAEADFEKSKQVLADWDTEIASRANRQKDALQRASQIDEKINEIEKQLKVPVPADEPASVTDARKMELKTRLLLLKAEKPALKNELAKYDVEANIGYPRINQDYLKLLAKRDKDKIDAMKAQIKKLRNVESEMRVKEARQKVFATNPILQPLAAKNQKYAEEIQALNKKVEMVDQKYSQTSQLLEDLKKQFDQTKEKEKSVGLTGPIGLLLRNQQAALPVVESLKQSIENRSQLINEVHLKDYELNDLWDNFPTVEEKTTEILKRNPKLTTEDKINLQQVVEETLTKQKEYLDTLIRSNKNYFEKLINLNVTENNLVKQSKAYSAYISERVFWIKSSAPVSLSELKQTSQSIRWLFSPSHWKQLIQQLKQDTYNNPVIYLTAFCCFVSLIYLAYNVRIQLRIMNKEIIRSNYRKFGMTARVAFLTLFIAIIWPGFIWFLAWRIGSHPNAPVFVKAVDSSLRQVAWLLFFWELIRQICRPLGLGESHFGWYKQTVSYVRRNIRWVIPFSLPLLFITLLLHGKEVDRNHDLLERLFFVALLIVYTVFARRVFHPRSGLFQSILNYNEEVWYDRVKFIIYFLTLLVPCSLILLSLIGFYFTAMSLFHLIFMTLWLFLIVIIFRALLLRWILIHHRQLSYQQNQQRLEALKKESLESSSETIVAGITTEEENPADLTKISAQIKKLINATMIVILLVGLLWIWGDTLPAFNRLDTNEFKLWSTSIQTVEETKDVDGNITQKTIDRLEPITYYDLGLALIFAIFAIVATKNLPGLLEFLILQRLPLDTPVKYAITSLARYFVALIGIFVVFSTIGLGWTKLQWLATALTFGLAFGLQEIFANFVSGLILLIERPIRVGDIITVDDVTGVVSRIRMRATTITNWDRKEYIVPNREFITGKILNWTLTDSVQRITITIGVAYGTDTNQASDLALKIVNEHPLILSEPAASITFESFGDSTLDLIIRAFLPDLENRLQVIHELHTSIHEQFNAAGIEIAFPQRDVHLFTGDKSLAETIQNTHRAKPDSEDHSQKP
ncbi:mechanosensitive ion channel domain-containing protein [Gimesia aquarii]|uniref:Miniconductance mechanosensitive channel MscM n=1 Tax=Gimesia aquarii TaxID=2527964 RepID=A0A517WZL1_9PLAN|nr:mechanosensitive ion channel domain-containing protein [Gimesia aquarii]QDU10684.1 Miniconductance mechanosensitive channel MscM precursor [Gimesia aquarii]